VRWRLIRAVARKDLLVVRRSRALMTPLVIVPTLLLVLLPLAVAVGPVLAGSAAEAELARVFESLPPEALARFGDGPPSERWLRLVQSQLLPSLFILVPFMVANVIAADAFAGERERKTLEALLYTPVSDAELLTAKVLAAWLPAVVVGLAGFVVQGALLALASASLIGRALLPDTTWLLVALWVAPAFAALGLSGMVLVSLRVRGTQEAMQLGGLLVLPVIALLVAQVRGVMLLGPAVALGTGVVVWGLAAALLVAGRRGFRRGRIVGRS
jgi:ABC-type Na+ efflux pump permease subunit